MGATCSKKSTSEVPETQVHSKSATKDEYRKTLSHGLKGVITSPEVAQNNHIDKTNKPEEMAGRVERVPGSDAPSPTNGRPADTPLPTHATSDESTSRTNDGMSPSSSKMKSMLMGEIQPNFWVGSIGALKEIQKSDKAWKIVSIVHAPKLVQFCRESAALLREQGRIHQHLVWPMADQNESPLLCEQLDEILSFMDGTSFVYPLLVHCAFGVSRSVSVCAAWLISRQGLSLAQALATIRDARPEASPNMGFIASLRALEQSEGSVVRALERQQRRRGVKSETNNNTEKST